MSSVTGGSHSVGGGSHTCPHMPHSLLDLYGDRMVEVADAHQHHHRHDLYREKLAESPKVRRDVSGRQHAMIMLEFEVVDGEFVILAESWA